MFRVYNKLNLHFPEKKILSEKNDKTKINTRVKGKIEKCHIKDSRVIKLEEYTFKLNM